MKKTLLISVGLLIASTIAQAQNVNIPDANFKAYLVGNTSINTNSDSEIQVSEAAAFNGTINCGSLSISDLTGIEAFTNLTELYCLDNSLTTLNTSQNINLTTLYCNSNNLASIDLSQNISLVELSVAYNNLTTIDISNNTLLSIFYGTHNQLSSIDVTQNTNLTELDFGYNSISGTVDVSQNTILTHLQCYNNSLSSLDVSQNTSLINLNFRNNNISDLDITQNTSLEILRCSNNDLSILKTIYTSTLVNLDASLNPNLTCIEVDDTSAANSSLNYLIDATASYSLDCNYILNINDFELAKSISIYPNPATSEISIISDKIIESIELIDVFGKVIKSSLNPNNTIYVSNLSNGLYFLQVHTKKGLAIKKFIKD
ncbi:leucine-rich repeat domain-containing protein [Thalassobellus citreus]|uniref:leucine-rich repeat domain-containing protein n=1 Tax=Thalassobellus citreus TaxID=3367752 RepID=UPI00378CB1A0